MAADEALLRLGELLVAGLERRPVRRDVAASAFDADAHLAGAALGERLHLLLDLEFDVRSLLLGQNAPSLGVDGLHLRGAAHDFADLLLQGLHVFGLLAATERLELAAQFAELRPVLAQVRTPGLACFALEALQRFLLLAGQTQLGRRLFARERLDGLAEDAVRNRAIGHHPRLTARHLAERRRAARHVDVLDTRAAQRVGLIRSRRRRIIGGDQRERHQQHEGCGQQNGTTVGAVHGG